MQILTSPRLTDLRRALGITCLVGTLLGPTRPAAAQCPTCADRVEIIRTEHGVPHIRAQDLEAAGYALAWVQMEDYGPRVAHGLVRARGTLARYFGADSIETDVRRRLAHRRAVETWPQQHADVQALYRGFAEGVNAFVRARPSGFPTWMPRDFTGPDVAALWIEPYWPSSADAWRSRQAALARARADSARRAGDGSNAWAIAPSRAARGRALLLRNPHLDWSAGYYEAHLTVPGVVDFYGDFRVGNPILLNGGFNARLGFATTNNDADNEALYALAVDSTTPDHVRWNGRAVPLERITVSVEVANGPGLSTETRELWRSPIGPVIERANGRVIVATSTTDGEFRKGEQFLRMMQARTLDEWKAAMRLQAHASSNLTYADADGHIFYVWNARPPRLPHPAGADTVAIPAFGDADVWRRWLPFDSLPQLLDPPGGTLQNANDPFHYTSPSAVIDSTPWADNISRPVLGLRSQLSLALVNAPGKLTLDEMLRRKHSARMLAAERFVPDLLQAVRAQPMPAEVAEAATLLERWDRTVRADARGAVLFAIWFDRYLTSDSALRGRPQRDRWAAAWATPWSATSPYDTPRGLADPARAARDFVWAVRETARRHGRVDVAWGAVHRIRRGTVDLPAEGCTGLLGCFRVLQFETQPDFTRVARGGDGWILGVEFGAQPEARSVLAYGQSADATSPWFASQAAMFARGETKPVRWLPRDVDRHAVTRYRPR
ncbi:MAG: penicillin acylase family protein [Gemmatimonadaceae bacterium]|nr:penicillin acylase family protein [Gemmatimonadaceae bacterium]